MTVALIGNGGVICDVDEARNQQVFQLLPGYPASAGGFFNAAGFTSAVVAAALATTTTLMSARLQAASTRKAYLTKLRATLSIATIGAAGGIPTILGLQRFTTATPTGGTARTAARLSGTKGGASDMTDIRDSNAALTVTSVVFGDLLGATTVPNNSTNIGFYEWIYEPIAPVELAAGDGICLRTQNAGPATATWNFSYGMHWAER